MNDDNTQGSEPAFASQAEYDAHVSRERRINELLHDPRFIGYDRRHQQHMLNERLARRIIALEDAFVQLGEAINTEEVQQVVYRTIIALNDEGLEQNIQIFGSDWVRRPAK